MITINGFDINFDLTSPTDLSRLEAAQKAMDEKPFPEPPKDENASDYLQQYIGWLNALLNLFGNFIDDTFGDGVAEKLLTNNPSLTKVLDVNDELDKALGIHAKAITNRFNKYKPNRATRRAK